MDVIVEDGDGRIRKLDWVEVQSICERPSSKPSDELTYYDIRIPYNLSIWVMVRNAKYLYDIDASNYILCIDNVWIDDLDIVISGYVTEVY